MYILATEEKELYNKREEYPGTEEMHNILARGSRIQPLRRQLRLQTLQFTRHLVKLLLQDHDPFLQLIGVLYKLMMVSSSKDLADLPVDPFDPDPLALHSCYDLCHLENCLLRNSGRRLPLES